MKITVFFTLLVLLLSQASNVAAMTACAFFDRSDLSGERLTLGPNEEIPDLNQGSVYQSVNGPFLRNGPSGWSKRISAVSSMQGCRVVGGHQPNQFISSFEKLIDNNLNRPIVDGFYDNELASVRCECPRCTANISTTTQTINPTREKAIKACTRECKRRGMTYLHRHALSPFGDPENHPEFRAARNPTTTRGTNEVNCGRCCPYWNK